MGTVDMDTTDSRLELKGSIPNGHVWRISDGKIVFYVYNDRYCVTKGYSDEDITITEDVENCKSPVEEDTGNSGEKTLTALAVDNFSVTNVDGTNPTVVTKPACLTDGTECTTGTPVTVRKSNI